MREPIVFDRAPERRRHRNKHVVGEVNCRHGQARNWATEIDKTEYTTAERCLAHTVGNSSSKSYDRSDRLELRRPIMAKWAQFISGETADNVVQSRNALRNPCAVTSLWPSRLKSMAIAMLESDFIGLPGNTCRLSLSPRSAF